LRCQVRRARSAEFWTRDKHWFRQKVREMEIDGPRYSSGSKLPELTKTDDGQMAHLLQVRKEALGTVLDGILAQRDSRSFGRR